MGKSGAALVLVVVILVPIVLAMLLGGTAFALFSKWDPATSQERAEAVAIDNADELNENLRKAEVREARAESYQRMLPFWENAQRVLFTGTVIVVLAFLVIGIGSMGVYAFNRARCVYPDTNGMYPVIRLPYRVKTVEGVVTGQVLCDPQKSLAPSTVMVLNKDGVHISQPGLEDPDARRDQLVVAREALRLQAVKRERPKVIAQPWQAVLPAPAEEQYD